MRKFKSLIFDRRSASFKPKRSSVKIGFAIAVALVFSTFSRACPDAAGWIRATLNNSSDDSLSTSLLQIKNSLTELETEFPASKREVALMQETFDSLFSLPPPESLGNFKADIRELLLNSKDPADFDAKLIAYADKLEHSSFESQERFAEAAHRLALAARPAESSEVSLDLAKLIENNDMAKLKVDQIYSLNLKRPDLHLSGRQHFRFSTEVIDFFNDSSQKYSGHRWLEALQMGAARADDQSGIKKTMGSITFSNGKWYPFELKLMGRGQTKRVGITLDADGTYYLKDIFEHD